MASGLNVSPGAAVGIVAFDASDYEGEDCFTDSVTVMEPDIFGNMEIQINPEGIANDGNPDTWFSCLSLGQEGGNPDVVDQIDVSSDGGALESEAFGGKLEGASVDFLRLVVDRYEFTTVTVPAGESTRWSPDFRWQVWGSGIAPLPSVVPEPGTLALFGAALVGFAIWRRRR